MVYDEKPAYKCELVDYFTGLTVFNPDHYTWSIKLHYPDLYVPAPTKSDKSKS